MAVEQYDFIVIGAGLSGVDAAYRLKTQLPDRSYVVLEAREEAGGTWSLFKYPGLRSDSSLTLFGLPWKPWVHEKDMAAGHMILDYIKDAAKSEGLDKKILYRHKMTGCSWSSDEQRWTVEVDANGQKKFFKTTFILACSGYYDYEKALQTTIPGIEKFQGTVAHPQFWPENLDMAGKKVVIIGSGATAITLLPVLAEVASNVTMLQRSPSYVFNLRSVSPVATFCKKYLPPAIAYSLIWWIALILENLFVSLNRRYPEQAKKFHMANMQKQLPPSIDVNIHFNPSYNVFDQRLCFCPDSDFFKALHRDNCDIVTDVIDTVMPDGILTKSGQKIDADVIITATGLRVHLFGGVVPVVDGKPIELGNEYAWRGAMLTGLPNVGAAIGYTMGSWTLGADSNIKMIIRVYKRMLRVGATSVMPVFDNKLHGSPRSVMDMSSTYFKAASDRLPKAGEGSPWYGRKNLLWDRWFLWFGSVTTGMKYIKPETKKAR